MKNILLYSIVLIYVTGISQTNNYADVALIVNDNSPISIEIGNYFQNARNIPNQNVIHVNAPTSERITDIEFMQIKTQIENHLLTYNLADSINYLVTTKGLPLKINSGCFSDSLPDLSCASFDSELSLILGNYASSIGESSSIPNPYFNYTLHFSRDLFGIYLVTRLDAYTKTDVINLIDRSGPSVGVNKNSAKAIVDVSNSTGGDSSFFKSAFEPAYNSLNTNLWNTDFDLNFVPLVSQNNVLAYLGIGHGPLPFQALENEWIDGSFGVMEMCNSSYTFDLASKDSADLLLGDILAEGCTSGYGNVDFVFFGNIMDPEILVNRYLENSQNFNLAESFYMAAKTLSWQTVIIGDPKASIVIDNTLSAKELEKERITIYPNPSNEKITINTDQLINSITVYDVKGSKMILLSQLESKIIEVNLDFLNSGIYTILIETDKAIFQEKLIKTD